MNVSGRGVGGFLSRIFSMFKRFVVPSVKKIASSEVGRSLGKAAASSAASFGEDILKGKPVKEAGKLSLNKGIEDLRKSVLKLAKKRSRKKQNRIKATRKRSTFFDP